MCDRFRRDTAFACALALVATHALPAADDEPYAVRLGELVNRYRATLGVRALDTDSGLAALARAHSTAMAKAGHLSHEGFQSRFRRSRYTLCVENVGWNHRTAQAQLDAWRHSPGHDRNLRDSRVVRMGAGEVSGYVTWIACR